MASKEEKYRAALEEIIDSAPEESPMSIEYWESGNFDDTYQIGMEAGLWQAAEIARKALRDD